jgi:hypothetical protein
LLYFVCNIAHNYYLICLISLFTMSDFDMTTLVNEMTRLSQDNIRLHALNAELTLSLTLARVQNNGSVPTTPVSLSTPVVIATPLSATASVNSDHDDDNNSVHSTLSSGSNHSNHSTGSVHSITTTTDIIMTGDQILCSGKGWFPVCRKGASRTLWSLRPGNKLQTVGPAQRNTMKPCTGPNRDICDR